MLFGGGLGERGGGRGVATLAPFHIGRVKIRYRSTWNTLTLKLALSCDQRVSQRGQQRSPSKPLLAAALLWLAPETRHSSIASQESVSSSSTHICSPGAVVENRTLQGEVWAGRCRRTPESSDIDLLWALGQVISLLWFLPLSELKQLPAALKIWWWLLQNCTVCVCVTCCLIGC